MKKFYIITLVIFCVIVVGLIIFRVVYMPWREIKEQKIMLGLSSPSFPFLDYSEAQLAKKYPQVKNADVPTRITPEETYAKFRQGLLENDLQMVLDQLHKDSAKYTANTASIKKAFDEGRFDEIYEKYPEEIVESTTGDAYAEYYFVYNDDSQSHFVNFIKNSDGDWKIDKL